MRVPRRRGQEEHEAQTALFAWAQLASLRLPELRLLYAVPNGGHRHPAVAGKLKAEGVKPGVLDIHLPVPRGPYHGLWIEMKSSRGQLSKHQKAWAEALADEGHAVHVCRSYEEARDALEAYLALPPAPERRGAA